MKSRLRVALLVRTGNDWSRKILMGVAQYAHENGGWDFTHPTADDHGEVTLPSGWKGDGIICRLTSSSLQNQILKSGFPAVNVSWLGKHRPEIVKVVSDEAVCAQTATEYFLERRFRNFGFIGFPPWRDYQPHLVDSIENSLRQHDLKLMKFEFPCEENSNRLRTDLEEWIKQLIQPTAVITWTSDLGRMVASICIDLGYSVPNAISILCIENDDLASSLSSIPLSNLDQDAWRVGYTAATALNQLIKGQAAPSDPVNVPPLSIVQRRSTEASAVDDPIVREAYRYIHECVTSGLNVDDVVRELGVSRRTLEKKFRKTLSMTPSQLIRRAKLQIVKRLLRDTTLTIPQVAERSGFSHAEVLIRAFKKNTGVTPTQFRSESL